MHLKLEIEEDLASLLRALRWPLDEAVRELVVLELYRRGTISSGKAAGLLRMSRPAFIRYASELGIPYYEMTRDERASEIRESWKL
jgi:predicted HTH domain antitoxin